MHLPISVTQSQLSEFLLNIALVRPVFIWGAPGIGKSSLVEQFAADVGNADDQTLPSWFMIEVVRDLPRLVERKDA